jgi:uncharacterized protein YjaG (DUF416 family)
MIEKSFAYICAKNEYNKNIIYYLIFEIIWLYDNINKSNIKLENGFKTSQKFI